MVPVVRVAGGLRLVSVARGRGTAAVLTGFGAVRRAGVAVVAGPCRAGRRRLGRGLGARGVVLRVGAGRCWGAACAPEELPQPLPKEGLPTPTGFTVLPQTLTGTSMGAWTLLPDSRPGDPAAVAALSVAWAYPPLMVSTLDAAAAVSRPLPISSRIWFS